MTGNGGLLTRLGSHERPSIDETSTKPQGMSNQGQTMALYSEQTKAPNR